MSAVKDETAVHVTAVDLQGPGVVHCPNPKMALWSTHPKVYLDVVTTGAFVLIMRNGKYPLPSSEGHHGKRFNCRSYAAESRGPDCAGHASVHAS